jgi:hypothetical protein
MHDQHMLFLIVLSESKDILKLYHTHIFTEL